MRVWELAAELGKKSSELVAELQELGFDPGPYHHTIGDRGFMTAVKL